MLEVSEEIYAFFQSLTGFTDIMGSRIYPVIAKVDTPYPFSVYTINEEQGQTKDGAKFIVTLSVYYEPDKFKTCATFADACKGFIEQEYEWLSSEVGFVEENLSIVANINFEINK